MKCLTSFFIWAPFILNYKDSKARRKTIAAGGRDRETVYRGEQAGGRPEDVAEDSVKAEFKDGMLWVHLPKAEKPKPKSIEVKVA